MAVQAQLPQDFISETQAISSQRALALLRADSAFRAQVRAIAKAITADAGCAIMIIEHTPRYICGAANFTLPESDSRDTLSSPKKQRLVHAAIQAPHFSAKAHIYETRFRSSHRQYIIVYADYTPLDAIISLAFERNDGAFSQQNVQAALDHLPKLNAAIAFTLTNDTSMRAIAQSENQDTIFISEVTHKLRNRVNAVHGFLEMVISGDAGDLNIQQREMLGYAHISALEMMEYIENLHFLLQDNLKKHVVNITKIQALPVLADIAQQLQRAADSEHVRLLIEADDATVVFCDMQMLWRALLNLTINAIKFNTKNGSVVLFARTEQNTTVLGVKDTGVGFSDDTLHILQKGAATLPAQLLAENPGLPIGVLTVQAIARLTGADFRVETQPGEGSVCSLTFSAGKQ